jgi:hypothetical protein
MSGIESTSTIKLIGSAAKNRILYASAFKGEAGRRLKPELEPSLENIPILFSELPKRYFFPTVRLLYREGMKGIEAVDNEVKTYASSEWGKWNASRILRTLFRYGSFLGFIYAAASFEKHRDTENEVAAMTSFVAAMFFMGGSLASCGFSETRSGEYEDYVIDRWVMGAKSRKMGQLASAIDALKKLLYCGFNNIEEALDVLGLGHRPLEEITIKEIKQAYRQAAFRMHSDRGGNDSEFIKIHTAFVAIKRFKGF